MIVIGMTVIEMIVIAIGSIVGDVAIVVVHHSVAVPVGSPVCQPQPKPPKTDAIPKPKAIPGPANASDHQPNPIVVDRFPVDIPRIVFRHVNHSGSLVGS